MCGVLGLDTFLSFVLYTLVYKWASANGYGNLTKCSGWGNLLRHTVTPNQGRVTYSNHGYSHTVVVGVA